MNSFLDIDRCLRRISYTRSFRSLLYSRLHVIGCHYTDRYYALLFILVATVVFEPGTSVLLLHSVHAGQPSQCGGDDILYAGRFQNAIVIRFKARSQHHPKGRLLLKFE